jgi:broad specificity phosphatase PhoE
MNAKGRRQIGKLKIRLQGESFHKIYVSDRKRAIDSARIIFKKGIAEKVPELREIHFGVFEGLTYDQIMKKYPVVYKRWLKDPFSVTIPKGEKLADFRKRVVKALNKIIVKHKHETVAIVCHGGPISIYVNHILKEKNFWKYIPRSASLSVIEHKNGIAKIRSLSDTKHLE